MFEHRVRKRIEWLKQKSMIVDEAQKCAIKTETVKTADFGN